MKIGVDRYGKAHLSMSEAESITCIQCSLPMTKHARGFYCQTCKRWGVLWDDPDEDGA